MNINEIRSMTIEDVKKVSIDHIIIKDHSCFFADLGEYFGYSVLVFRNGKHIYYANDFQLHHAGKDVKDLREFYIESLSRKLFTDSELLNPISTYSEYEAKNYFVRNYWIMQFDYLSIFGIGEEAKKEFDSKISKYPYMNRYSFCYVNDENIILRQSKFMKNIEKEYEKLQNSLDTFREMIRKELSNHEACITCDYKDALFALGLNYDNLTVEKQNIVNQELKRQIELY